MSDALLSLKQSFSGLSDDAEIWFYVSGEPVAKLRLGDIRAAFPAHIHRYVSSSRLNIRAEANADSAKIGSLEPGVSVAVVGDNPGGYVRLWGIEGYVLSSGLK